MTGYLLISKVTINQDNTVLNLGKIEKIAKEKIGKMAKGIIGPDPKRIIDKTDKK